MMLASNSNEDLRDGIGSPRLGLDEIVVLMRSAIGDVHVTRDYTDEVSERRVYVMQDMKKAADLL